MRKNLFLILLITSILVCGFCMNIKVGSASEYTVIKVVPESTIDTGLTPGKNYTVSIYTNYTGSDIWSWQFSFSYNPNVLHAGLNKTDIQYGNGFNKIFYTSEMPVCKESEYVYVGGLLQERDVDYKVTDYSIGRISFKYAPGDGEEVKITYLHGVVQGEIITGSNAKIEAGAVNNTLGTLSLSIGWFYYETPPPETGSGPGVLANVTFRVVGYGFSDITFGDDTKLRGYSDGSFYDIINKEWEPERVLDGFFSNVLPRHDVAVVSLVAPDTAAIEQPVPVNVTVANEGTYDENVTLTVYNDTTVIDSTTFLLGKGLSDTFSFSWDTSGLTLGGYTINATATTVSEDEELGDNSKTKSVTLQYVHDVAVVSLVAPDTAAIEQPVPISVTVVNEGSYQETVTLTVYNDTTVIDSTTFTLAKGPTSNTSSFSWDTSGLTLGGYTINATATTVSEDEELGDNSKTKSVTLQYVHDVAVVSLVAPSGGVVGHPVPISVTVVNEGSYQETVTLTVYNQTGSETTVIDSTTFTLAKGPTSNTSSFSWDTSDAEDLTYKINATATTVSEDEDLGDNTKTKYITMSKVNDVAVVSVTAPLRGNVDDTVLINVTVKNVGSFTETFNVTAYYDDTYIVLPNGKNYTTVTLAPAEFTTLAFTWNTTGVAAGFYVIKAWASNVTGESSVADNTFTDGTVLVSILGDVDGDGAVGTSDLIALNEAYGSKLGDSNWDVYCDLNGDDKIDASDLFVLGKKYGESVP